MKLSELFFLVLLVAFASSGVVTYSGIPNDPTSATAWKNGALFNKTFALLNPGDVFVIPNQTFFTIGGIMAFNKKNLIVQIDGTIIFSDNQQDVDNWPSDVNGNVFECFLFVNFFNVTFTSSTRKGLINGNGAVWWGIPFIGYIERGENRPRLFHITNSRQILVEYLFFKDSPYWTFWANGIDGLEVRYCNITAARDNYQGHDLDDLSAFNTDGFDVSGRNVWIHHSSVWNQDDCFCVKDASENVLVENVVASGLGLTVGSIGGTSVRNVTFRNVYMPNTYKGIYMKFRADGGNISDILYENIYMASPEQWPIWIGPAQQADSSDICAAHPCSLCWPWIPFASCNAPPDGRYKNIMIRNVTIDSPSGSAGVIIGSPQYPIENLVFDNVLVTNPPEFWSPNYWTCSGVQSGKATGNTWPVPSCFTSARR